MSLPTPMHASLASIECRPIAQQIYTLACEADCSLSALKERRHLTPIGSMLLILINDIVDKEVLSFGLLIIVIGCSWGMRMDSARTKLSSCKAVTSGAVCSRRQWRGWRHWETRWARASLQATWLP